MIYKRNGVVVDITDVVNIDGTQFPRGFFLDEQERVRYSIYPADEIVYPNAKFWQWTTHGGEISISPRNADEVKAELIAEAKALRDTKTLNNGFKVPTSEGDKWFHSDLYSRGQQQTLFFKAQALLAAGADASAVLPITPWRTMDGSCIPLTIQNIIDLVDSEIASDSAYFVACTNHEEAISAISGADDRATAKALEAYNLLQGWPKGYGE